MTSERTFSAILAAALVLGCVLGCPGPTTCPNPVQPQAGEVFELPGFGTITTLGSLGGPDYPGAWPTAINASGQVVGVAYDRCGWDQRAFLWQNGTIADLGTLGGTTSLAADIDASGKVVGESSTGKASRTFWIPFSLPYVEYERLAYVWEAGVMTSLGTLPGALQSGAKAINSAGQIVGYAGFDVTPEAEGATAMKKHARGLEFAQPSPRAVTWELVNGTWQVSELADLGAGVSSAADLNALGQIVGWARVGDGQHALLWLDGVAHDLGTLGGQSSGASRINDAGQIVGWAELTPDAADATGSSQWHAVVWQPTGDAWSIQDIGTLGGRFSEALDVNAAGQTVGWSDTADGSRHAFIWQAGTMTDLNDLLPAGTTWVIEEAHAINDAGQIAAVAAPDENQLSQAVLIDRK